MDLFPLIILAILFVLLKNKEKFWNMATRRDFKLADIRGEPNLIYPYGYIYGPFHYGIDGQVHKTAGGYFLY